MSLIGSHMASHTLWAQKLKFKSKRYFLSVLILFCTCQFSGDLVGIFLLSQEVWFTMASSVFSLVCLQRKYFGFSCGQVLFPDFERECHATSNVSFCAFGDSGFSRGNARTPTQLLRPGRVQKTRAEFVDLLPPLKNKGCILQAKASVLSQRFKQLSFEKQTYVALCVATQCTPSPPCKMVPTVVDFPSTSAPEYSQNGGGNSHWSSSLFSFKQVILSIIHF